jgi:hypothetical protein
MAYVEFTEELRSIASHHLDLSKRDAKFSFDLFIHHGQQPRQALEDMDPVYSLQIVRGRDDGKAVIDRFHIDEDFLGCRANGGCKRCTSPEI